MAESATGGIASFGRYRVQERLGAGGMGAVYLARDDELDRHVAVKVLRPLFAAGNPSAELIERFRREARAVALVSHPNVVKVFDQGIQDDVPYLVMELVNGPTLSSRLAGGPLPLREVRTLGIQIASALAAAHAAGVVHRDVKPSNVLQAEAGSWKLADFGIAHTADSSLTITGQFLGTPSFAAPEALEGRAVGPAADVYSLAATLHAALTGEPPYGDANLAQLIIAHASRRPAPVATRCPGLPPTIAGAIDRALSTVPEERPSATELAEALALDDRATPTAGHAVAQPAAGQAAPPTAIARPQAGARAGRGVPRPFVVGAIAGGALALLVAVCATEGDGGGEGRRGRPGAPMSAPGVGGAHPAAAAMAPFAAADDRPPWMTEVPAELATRRRGKPSELEKRWRKAHEKLLEGEWDKGAEELERILHRDPGNETARRWLEYLDQNAGWDAYDRDEKIDE